MVDSVRFVNNITKEYPDMFKIIIYKDTKVFTISSTKRNRKEVNDSFYIPKISSLNRTKTLIHDIVLCNNFELFCTFTFNPDKIDSFNFGRCYCAMSTWLHHQNDRSRERGKKFFYLIVPEQHKSGRWHFHALISGYIGSLKPSGNLSASGRPIYNITSFRNGFTTAVEIDSREGVSNYVTKYITKDFIKQFNQRRFFCSRNLSRPVKTINSNIFKRSLPIGRKFISENSQTFEYFVDKDFVV